MKRVPTIKILAITGLANLLELYDFTLFAVLLPVLVGQFFPHKDYLILGYLAFALSFLIAPIGSIIWGYIGDKFGSSTIFKTSLFAMALPSFAISLLPTFQSAGWIAPILLITLRIIQGFSASGEVLAAKIYAFERLGHDKFLLASSIISAFGALGVLLAAVFGSIIAMHPGFDLWRIPFAVGGSMLFIMLLVRMLVDKEAPSKQHNIKALSVLKIIKNNPKAALGSFAASAILGIFSYFMHAFLVSFQVTHLGHELADAYYTTEVGLLGTVIFAILTGTATTMSSHNPSTSPHSPSMSSRGLTTGSTLPQRQPLLMAILSKWTPRSSRGVTKRGRGVIGGGIKHLLRASLLINAVLSIPLYLLLLLKIELITYISIFLLGGLLGIFASISGVYVITSFAQEERCRGALLVNAFGVAIFGGLTPLVMTALAGIDILLPGAMLGISFIIGYICICA